MRTTRTAVLAIARARRQAQTGEGRRRRLAGGLALQHVADAIGVSVATVWRWENSKSVPCGDAAVRWVELLDELGKVSHGGDPDVA